MVRIKYIDIFAIYKTLSKFKATGIPFDFYKIGENPNDIEHYYCDTEDFAISNKFVLDKILQPV